ncbi:MAG: hypothetical protein ACE5NN_04080 [Candidatus Bathyarchaeia archaeon]
MAKFKFNIFFFISIICTLLLVGYLWAVFLPLFEGTLEYDVIRNVIIFITMLLFASVILTVLQMRRSE